MFYPNVFHFQCAYSKTTRSWGFGFDVSLFMSGELLKLLPIVEVIVIYKKELLHISLYLWPFLFLYLQSLRLNFQNVTCLRHCIFVCVCVAESNI